MYNDHNVVLICAEYARDCLTGQQSIEDRLAVSFRHVQRFWLSSDESVRQRGALAAVIAVSNDEDRERLARSIEALHQLGTAISGRSKVSIDRLAEIVAQPGFIPVHKLWREACDER